MIHMRHIFFILGLSATIVAATALSQSPKSGPYKIVKDVKVGGPGGWDYVNADPDARRLYIARRDQTVAHLTLYDLDTLQAAGEVPMVSAHGAVVDSKSGHGIASSKPITMFDRKTLQVIKKIDVMGNPDGLMFDPFNRRVHVLSHQMPYDTVIDPAEGTVVGTIDLGGQPEQAASDGNGTIYVDLEDKSAIAVVDAKTLAVTAKYDIAGSGGTCAGLALDAKNHILFATCRNPQNMVILNAKDGKIITTIPIGPNTDGAAFNPKTMEAFSSNGGDGTLTIVKENSPTSFVLEQSLQTKAGARTMALDPKTNQIYLVTADLGPPPPASAENKGRGGRGALLPDSFSILVVGK
jgi:DNA-binding beta-propeller fold protein YncE